MMKPFKLVKRGLAPLRKLQWKLTLSYTLVTVVALLIMELILLGVALVFLSSSGPPYVASQVFRYDFAPRLAPYMADETAEYEAIDYEAVEMELVGPNVASQETPSATTDDGFLFVVDDERTLIAANFRVERFPTGERFEAEEVRGLEPLLDAALDGESDAARLSARTPEGLIIAAAPIFADDGSVVGAVGGTFRMPNLTVPFLVVVGVSVVALLVPAGIIGAIFGLVTSRGPVRRLQNLADASEAWSKGDFSVVVKDSSRDEIGALSRDLNHMAAELENLIETRQELASLETRNQFARDLHDSVKQQVFATSLQVAAAKAMLARDSEAAGVHLAQAEELVHGAQKELNLLIHEMRPAALEDRGLAPALRDYVKNWSERGGVEAGVHVRGEREVSLELEQAVFRVAQEMLANVARHSGASWAEVELIYDSETVTLRATDDGRGFDPSSLVKKGGFGLESMGERAERLGGTFEVESAPGEGTRAVLTLPTAKPETNGESE